MSCILNQFLIRRNAPDSTDTGHSGARSPLASSSQKRYPGWKSRRLFAKKAYNRVAASPQCPALAVLTVKELPVTKGERTRQICLEEALAVALSCLISFQSSERSANDTVNSLSRKQRFIMSGVTLQSRRLTTMSVQRTSALLPRKTWSQSQWNWLPLSAGVYPQRTNLNMQSRSITLDTAKKTMTRSSILPTDSYLTSNVKDLMSLQDRVVVITGAAKGIGLALAFGVAEAGGKVAIIDASPEPSENYTRLQDICSELRYYQ